MFTKTNGTRRVLAMALVICMILGMFTMGVSAETADSEQVVASWNFDDGTQGWTGGGEVGISLEQGSNTLYIATTAGSTKDSATATCGEELALIPGHQYRITFEARAWDFLSHGKGAMIATVTNYSADDEKLESTPLNEFVLLDTTAWTNHELTFVASDDAEYDYSKLSFCAYAFDGGEDYRCQVTIEDMVLVDCGEVVSDEDGTVASWNFDDGTQGWTGGGEVGISLEQGSNTLYIATNGGSTKDSATATCGEELALIPGHEYRITFDVRAWDFLSHGKGAMLVTVTNYNDNDEKLESTPLNEFVLLDVTAWTSHELTFVASDDAEYAYSKLSFCAYAFDGSEDYRCQVTIEDVVLVDCGEHTHEYDAVVTEPTCTEGGYTTYTCSCGDTYTADEVAALGHEITEFVKIEDDKAIYKCVRCDVTETRDLVIDENNPYKAISWDFNDGTQGWTGGNVDVDGDDLYIALNGGTSKETGKTTAPEDLKLVPGHLYRLTLDARGWDLWGYAKHAMYVTVTDYNAAGEPLAQPTSLHDLAVLTIGEMTSHEFLFVASDDPAYAYSKLSVNPFTVGGGADYRCQVTLDDVVLLDCGEAVMIEVPNGDFETYNEAADANHFPGWTTATMSSRGTTRPNYQSDPYEGAEMMHLYASESYWECAQRFTTAEEVTISGMVKNVGDGSSEPHFDVRIVAFKADGTYDATYVDTTYFASSDWVGFQATYTKPADVDNFRVDIRFMTNNWGGTYIDDVKMFVTEAATNADPFLVATAAPIELYVPHTHEYSEVVTEPTCTESGYTTYTCACGDSYTANETAALGHSYNADVTEPTCTEGGYTTYTCACGDTYTADETEALGHDYSVVVETVEPTFEADGYTTYKCSRCDATENRDVVAAKVAAAAVNGEKFITLAEALAAVQAGDTLTLLADATIANTIEVTADLTIDGNGKTLTYTGASRAINVNNADSDADLTISNLTIDCTASYCERGISYNDSGVLTLTDVTIGGKNVNYAVNLPGSSDNATVVITDSAITGNIALNVWGENVEVTATGTDFTSPYVSTVETCPVVAFNNDGSTAATGSSFTVIGGSIISVANTTAVSTNAKDVTVNISDETVVQGTYSNAVAAINYGENSYTFTSLQDAIDKAQPGETVILLADTDEAAVASKVLTIKKNGFAATGLTAGEGYAVLNDLDDNYVIGAKPTATVNDLGAMTIAASDYKIYDGSLHNATVDMPLSFVMQFVADQTAEDMVTSPYADWYADFVITFEGLENGSFNAEGCYLAGFYGETEYNGEQTWDGLWVKIPVDGILTSIEEGVRYPVMLGVGMGQKYDYICSGVQSFSCAMYLPEHILEANPNLKVKLELAMVDDSKGESAAYEALLKSENQNVYIVEDHTYVAEDFVDNYVAKIGNKMFATLQEAVDAAQAGDTVTLLADATGAGVVINKSITIDLGGCTYTVDKAVGSQGTATLGFQILKNNDVIIKNGTLTSTNVVEGKEVKMLIQNYADLTLTDVALVDNTDHILYALSNNCGEVLLNGSTSITTDAVAFDVYDYSAAGYAVPAVTVSTTGTIAGDVEAAGGTLALEAGTFTGDLVYTAGTVTKADAVDMAAPAGYEWVEGVLTEIVEEPTGTIDHMGNTLSLDGFIYLNQYTTIDGFGGQEYIEANGGLLIWTEALTEEEATFDNAEIVKEGLTYDTKNKAYFQRTDGIPTKKFADELYMRAYVKASDGTYYYGELREYSVQDYLEGRLDSETAKAEMKNLAATMLHYGAAAQIYFNYNVEDLANAAIAEKWPADAWDETLLTAPVDPTSKPDHPVEVNSYGKTLTLDGMLLVNFYFNEAEGQTYEIAGGKLQIWDEEGLTDLTDDNISNEFDLVYTEFGTSKIPLWAAATEGIAARDYSDTFYARAKIVDTEGNVHYSDVIPYNAEEYARGRLESTSAKEAIKNLVKLMVTYGERADQYFISLGK